MKKELATYLNAETEKLKASQRVEGVKGMTLSINAKCSDLFSASLVDGKGMVVGEYDGYVPDFMPGEHYGDYVELKIEVATGRILNWKVPSKAQLNKVFKEGVRR
jgi:hypothetical protein